MTDRPTLNAALADWATTEPAGAGDPAALARILQHAETIATQPTSAAERRSAGAVRPKSGWMVGGALAASFAIAVLLASRPGDLPGGAQGSAAVIQASAGDRQGGSVMLAEADGSESAAFALLYTPTVEEEYQL